MFYSRCSAAKQIYVVWLKPGRVNTVQLWTFLDTFVTLSVGLLSSVDPSGVVFVCMLLHTCHSMSKFGELQQIAAIYGYAYHMLKSADLKCTCVFVI